MTQDKPKAYNIRHIDTEMQIRILTKIKNHKSYIDTQDQAFTRLAEAMDEGAAIVYSIVYAGSKTANKPNRNSKSTTDKYSGIQAFEKVARYLGQKTAERLEKECTDGVYAYLPHIDVPCTLDLYRQVTEADFHGLITSDWEAYKKTEEYKRESYYDGTWSAEQRPLIGWCSDNAGAKYGLSRFELREIIERHNTAKAGR